MIELDQTLIIQIVNFIIFLIILNHLIFKPVVRTLEDRRERIEGTRERAKLMESEIRKRIEEYEARIRGARSEATEERERLRREAKEVSKQIVEEARIDLARDIPLVRKQVAVETDRARRELEKRMQDMALDIARRVLGREIS